MQLLRQSAARGTAGGTPRRPCVAPLLQLSSSAAAPSVSPRRQPRSAHDRHPPAGARPGGGCSRGGGSAESDAATAPQRRWTGRWRRDRGRDSVRACPQLGCGPCWADQHLLGFCRPDAQRYRRTGDRERQYILLGSRQYSSSGQYIPLASRRYIPLASRQYSGRQYAWGGRGGQDPTAVDLS